MYFKGFVTGGVIYKRSRAAGAIKVQTYTEPESAAMFAAGGVGRTELTARDVDHGEVPILDRKGTPMPGALAYLAHLLSNDEIRLLTLFGVDVEAIAREGFHK